MPKPAILEKEYNYKNTKAVVIDKSRDDLRDSELYTGQKTWRDKKKKKKKTKRKLRKNTCMKFKSFWEHQIYFFL